MSTLVTSFLDGSSLFLLVTRTIIESCMSLNFCQIQSPTTELAALEHLQKTLCNDVSTLSPSFLIGSYLFLQITMTIKSWMGLKFGRIGPGPVELAVFEFLEISYKL